MEIEEAVWHGENTAKEVIQLQNQIETYEPEIQDSYNIFNIKFANEWMESAKQTPRQSELFGEFWLEGELAILFSDTNLGKSTLAMQIAESIARGESVAPMTFVPKGQKVLYVDFEMSEKQFESRYSLKDDDGNITSRYEFSGNLLRAQMAAHDELPHGYKSVSEFIQFSLIKLLRETGVRVVIIDNITYLKGANENAQSASRLMKGLRWMKDHYGLSVLALAHTPKLAYTSPLSLKDIQGSKMLSNFADNVFAIGKSVQQPDMRYLKHLKIQNDALTYGVKKVMLYRMVKTKNFLQFEFVDYANERDHLVWYRDHPDGERAKLITVAKKLYTEGASLRRIGMILGISHVTAFRYLQAGTPMGETILQEKDLKRLQEEKV